MKFACSNDQAKEPDLLCVYPVYGAARGQRFREAWRNTINRFMHKNKHEVLFVM
jgi:hypothetical protein